VKMKEFAGADPQLVGAMGAALIAADFAGQPAGSGTGVP